MYFCRKERILVFAQCIEKPNARPILKLNEAIISILTKNEFI